MASLSSFGPFMCHWYFAQKCVMVLECQVSKKEPWSRSQKSWVLVPSLQVPPRELELGVTGILVKLMPISSSEKSEYNKSTYLQGCCPLLFLDRLVESSLRLRDFSAI